MTRYHVVAAERLLKTDLQAGGYKPTLLGFSFQLRILPRDGKVTIATAARRCSALRCPGTIGVQHLSPCPSSSSTTSRSTRPTW